jgi:hypothetical protein
LVSVPPTIYPLCREVDGIGGRTLGPVDALAVWGLEQFPGTARPNAHGC